MNTTKLSVNINKIALLRNSRITNIPNVLNFAQDCIRYGADGITIHPRPDERHIRKSDVYDLKSLFPRPNCEYNIEGFPSRDFINLVKEIKPEQVTLVPDAPEALTSSEGWNTVAQFSFLKEIINELQDEKIRVSLFMDTNLEYLEAASELGVERIEFYTGKYAEEYIINRENIIVPFINAANKCGVLGLGINAGHDLNLENLQFFKENIPSLLEVSIGHALITDCLYFGLENVIPMYLRLLNKI